MSVSVEFRPFSDCRLNEDGYFVLESQGGTKYRLPQLIIAPGWDNIPHIYSIDARVSGLVESAKTRLLETYRIPGGALKRRPIRLEREDRTPPPPGLIDLGDELQDKPFELTVTVGYYNSGEDSAPVTENPLQASAKAIMLVSPNRATRVPDEPVTIDVSPKHKILHENPLAVLLTLTTTGPDSQPPTTALADGQERMDPTLQDIIKAALTEKPRLLEQRGPQGERYWERNIQIEVDGAIRKRLQADYSTSSQRIGLVSQCGGAAVQHVLEIDFRPLKNVFTDWLCIDFGTSNSAVALFDQTKRPRSDGLPKEQLEYLSRTMNEWLNADSKDVFKTSGGVAEEWRMILQQIGEELTDDGPAALKRLFRTGDENEKLNIIRRIEKQDMSPETRRAVFSRLNRILQQTFWTPALSQETIFPIKLDQASGKEEIPSEAEVRALNPLQVKVGEQARANRRQAEANGHDTQGRFHISCKQYLGTDQEFQVNLDVEASGRVKYDALIREIWRDLIRLTDSYRERNKQQHGQGRIQKAIITYPTVSPPGVRRRIRKLAQEIGINSVEISYDEAVAAAIFYLMRDLGGEIDFGLDAFVSRSRPLGDKGIYWTQNVLVFDIGGGTTDIALIRLMLEDQTGPQMYGQESNHSAGGRYFKITPEILGSSGHMQLGGDLITLRTFLGMKTLLAEEILERFPQNSKVLDAVNSFPPALRGDDGKYARGKLIELICEDLSKDKQPSSDYEMALGYVEQLVPTRWEDKSGQERSRARNRFNLLWALAEDAKQEFGKEKLTKFDWTDPVDVQSHSFEPSSAKLEDVLENLVTFETQPQEGQRIRLSMSRAMFESLARPVIREAASIARELLKSRLTSSKGATTYEQLDWLILSGQTCHLSLVDKELRHELENAQVFCWNPDKVTFDPKYSKLAASIGACWAEHLRRHVQHPEGVYGPLSEGSNLLYFDVKNLFFFLPCLFERHSIGSVRDRLFNIHDKLCKLDNEEVGKARTKKWLSAALQTTIHRYDFEKQKNGHKWCDCDFSEQVKEWGMSDEEWRREIKYQAEVDQTLNIRLFFCRGQPYFCFEPSEFKVVIPGVVAINGEQEKEKVLACDIVVGLNTGGNANSRHTIFKAGDSFDRFVHRRNEESERIAAMVSKPLPAFYINDYHIVHYCAGAADSGEWTKAGIIKKPGKPSDYEQLYYATLDVEGTLTFHAGEVPYWTSTNPEVLRDDKERGRVYIVEPVSERQAPADDRNPFCGRH